MAINMDGSQENSSNKDEESKSPRTHKSNFLRQLKRRSLRIEKDFQIDCDIIGSNSETPLSAKSKNRLGLSIQIADEDDVVLKDGNSFTMFNTSDKKHEIEKEINNITPKSSRSLNSSFGSTSSGNSSYSTNSDDSVPSPSSLAKHFHHLTR